MKVFLIVIGSEILRSYLMSIEYKQRLRKNIHQLLSVAIFVLLDVTICTKVYDLYVKFLKKIVFSNYWVSNLW